MAAHLVRFHKPVEGATGLLVYRSKAGTSIGTHVFEDGAFTITKHMVNDGGRNGCFTTPVYHVLGPAIWAARSRLDERCSTLFEARTQCNWVIDPNWDAEDSHKVPFHYEEA